MSDTADIRVIIADSQFLIVESLQNILNSVDGISVRAIARSRHELYSILRTDEQALLITDPFLLDFSGADELGNIRRDYPQVSVLVLTHSLSKSEFVEFRKAGIHAIIFKTTDRTELLAAIESAVKGRKYYTPELLDLILQENDNPDIADGPGNLTQSEIEIVKMISGGYTTKEIAQKRHVSFHTVNTHRKNIFRKLGVTNTSELIMQAIKSGWIDNIEYYI
jgi:DNA-binding NarL/FixJ family response regulator